ncbi:TPA: hypothetical protein HA278_08295 [Candidatus Woesearchaeota archaeon]|jgi:ribonuclease BN (tRNA processing enzyme)|nr:hypothetical protein [archaeon]HIJ12032.1 hypothetical protein [Candidatus Woesearchaeota archaeon]|tara:strand:+ start:470 stop:1276 length:807 start_codon:yes stop_codon:yes gene_type:complete
MANVIFLGTAGSSPVATKQFRASGGIIVQFEDLQFHLDPGPGALNKAKEYGINPHHTTAVLVSNSNLINCNDLNIVVEAMTHSGIEHRGIVIGSKTVIGGTEEKQPYFTRFHQNMVEKMIPLKESHKVGIELAQINALPVQHTDEHACGFKFLFPKFTLSYISDTKWSQELMESVTGSDILILNVPFPGGKGQGTQLDTETAIKIISHVRPRVAIITHFGLEMLKANPLQEAREVQRITGVQCIAAYDGLKISSSGFGAYKAPVRGFD